MRMESTALKFDPQVMALAMPTDSAFTKGAEGISNIGKVFIEGDKRKEESALNALKMEEANQSIIGKMNENSVFGEKQERERTNHVLDKRTKLFEGLKKENEYNADVKKVEESGLMEKLKGVLPTPLFYTDGKIDKVKLNDSRAEFLNSPEWKGKEHIVNAMFDSKYKEMTEAQEAQLKNGKIEAESYKINEEAKTVRPKSNAYIATQKSAQTKNYSGANLDNVNAGLAPEKVAIQRDKEARLNKRDSGPNNPKTWEQNIALKRMPNLVAGYDDLAPKQKLEVDERYRTTGVLPSNVRPLNDDESDKYTGTHRAIYSVPATAKPKESASSGYSEGTVIKNSQGIHMVMKNGAWVKQ